MYLTRMLVCRGYAGCCGGATFPLHPAPSKHTRLERFV
ncbi:ORFL59W [Human betaherpesvirus 5]|nr:ORFL59W [Human betaherpesvirus 5]QHX40363.1 ORFL59W [Human betaherpesvirus 5]